MENQDPNVPEEVYQLIESNGNNFHAKVARWFTNNDWHVIVSPYYMDQTQGKAREIDLVVEKPWPALDHFGRLKGYIITRLFIECKYIPHCSVFWFSDRDRESAQKLVCKDYPDLVNNTRIEKHHYLDSSSKVAKLFANVKSNSQENDLFYKALNQSLNAMISMEKHPTSVPLEMPDAPVFNVMNFPVVVCNSFEKMFSADFQLDLRPQPIQSNFQLEVLYAYIDTQQKPQNNYFLLDFVEFGQLGNFHTVIGNDVNI